MKGRGTVTTATRTDEQNQKDAVAELMWDACVQPREIGVKGRP